MEDGGNATAVEEDEALPKDFIRIGQEKVHVLDGEKWGSRVGIVMASNCRGAYDVEFIDGNDDDYGGREWSLKLRELRRVGSDKSLQEEADELLEQRKMDAQVGSS